MPRKPREGEAAVRLTLHGDDVGGRCEATVARARELGVLGWVREDDDGAVRVHAEGPAAGVVALHDHLAEHAASVDAAPAKLEGHEQFAIRGVPAGVFVVQEHQATSHHYDLRLEVGGVMRSWAVPKEPSMDPADRRLAVQVEDHTMAYNDHVSETVQLWDRGTYEQGGRVPWPEALERGHAVFVLHGERLQGGFVLQRTRGEGVKSQWLLLKRRET